jgi:DNA-binding NarL/FixJ family response regulator
MPDVVFIGLHRDSSSGQNAMRMVLDAHPSAVVVVVGAVGDAPVLAAAVTNGASGVMLWDAHPSLHSAVRPPLQHRTHPHAPQHRSPLELGVLREFCRGRSNLEIGHDLELSQDSVKNAARRVFLKLGARDRAHAVALAMRHGLAI